MLINEFTQLDSARWTLKDDAKVDPSLVEFYGSKSLLANMDDKVREQITNVARLPGLVAPAMTMPDAHWGYGFPIGGVAAFDADQGGIISAGGVGFDISCGVRTIKTDLKWQQVLPKAQSFSEALYNVIPAGVGVEGRVKLNTADIDDMLTGGASWAIDQGFGERRDLNFIEEQGQMTGANPGKVSDQAKKRQRGQMGTLGSGNHYLEIQVVNEIFDEEAAKAFGLFKDQVLITIHCGSRGLGHQIGSDYLVQLAKSAQANGIQLPEKELACAPILSDEGQNYLGAMNAGINCAFANRQILSHLARQTLAQFFSEADSNLLYDVSHNTCKKETVEMPDGARELYIHRKGATRAFGPNHPGLPVDYQQAGQPVLVGGSMGTSSFILAGNGPEYNRAFASASHGAGRAMSRRQATKHFQGQSLVKELSGEGILIRSRSMRGVAEEAPGAYKDVEEVAQATESAGLARRVVSVKPRICVKG